MNFQRTTDYSLVHQILTSKDVYEHMGDDYLPRPEDFMVNRHPEARYVIACHSAGLVGLFSFFPRSRVCWELHVCMLPEATTQEKWEAARGLAPWLAERTDCRRLVGEVPRWNHAAVIFCTHGIGLKYVGTHPRAFMKFGKLQDLIILGMPINSTGDVCRLS